MNHTFPEPGTYGVTLFVRNAAGETAATTRDITVREAPAPQVVGGTYSTCALRVDGRVKCWGWNAFGQLGVGDTANRGDQPGEMGAALPAVDLGIDHTVYGLALGEVSACALLEDDMLRCWGFSNRGQLGRGDTETVGDQPGEMGDALPVVDLGAGRTVQQFAMGRQHACAVLDNGSLKCWGDNSFGQLGLGDQAARGDQPGEMGDALPAVDLGTGRTAVAVTAGLSSTCVLLDDATVKCWGENVGGVLGQGDTANRGDQPGEMGDALAPVDLGTGAAATAVAAGTFHVCALLESGSVKCWGFNPGGQVGLGDTTNRGDQPGEMGDALGAVPLGTGRTAVSLPSGWAVDSPCALLDDATVKCWGYNDFGQLGQGDTEWRGDLPGDMGDALAPVNLGSGRTATAVGVGQRLSCAVLDDRWVKCWGLNDQGQLGQGDTDPRGDQPGEMGDALAPADLGPLD